MTDEDNDEIEEPEDGLETHYAINSAHQEEIEDSEAEVETFVDGKSSNNQNESEEIDEES